MSVSAAAAGPQRRKEAVVRMQQGGQVKESGWMEEATPKRWNQPKGNRTDINKEARLLRCTLVNGST